MKIKLIIVILLVAFTVKAQEISYKTTGPIQKISGFVIGNEDDGFVKIDYNYLTLRIHKVDSKTYKTNLISLDDKVLKGVQFNKYLLLGKDVFLFYARKEVPYVLKIDNKGNVSEEIKLADKVESLYYDVYPDKINNLFIINFDIGDDNEFTVFDNEFNKVKTLKWTKSKSTPYPNVISAVYNKEDNIIYAQSKYFLRDKKDNYTDEFAYGLAIIEGDKDVMFYDKILEDSRLLSNNVIKVNNEYLLTGVAFSKKDSRLFSFVAGMSNGIDLLEDKDVNFAIHQNYKDVKVKTGDFKGRIYDYKYLADGSFITCLKLGVELGERYTNLIFTRIDKNGKIQFNSTVPINGVRLSYDNYNYVLNSRINPVRIKFNADDKNIYVVYEDYLKGIKLKNGTKYDGRYILGTQIDESGVLTTKILFNSEKDNKVGLYHTFANNFNSKPNTFVSYIYKKKKEDLIIEVKFED
jgi:hypothetical protein